MPIQWMTSDVFHLARQFLFPLLGKSATKKRRKNRNDLRALRSESIDMSSPQSAPAFTRLRCCFSQHWAGANPQELIMRNKIRCSGIKLALSIFARPQSFVRKGEEKWIWSQLKERRGQRVTASDEVDLSVARF
jgi:hypothetical protein